ncbi:hypothetical protein H1O16_gp435 [Burkholderia phage BcepSaruman]|uniref:Uncharacterized protein n=1 Tax=Burkholderia phage BcepSaruman TaxID=2530032 RepID=A0A4D5ZIG1_9CAUD|nr:hypothetical protein H1O16_gp435 [Burkholderia phage BcepSaruman]QBX06848.1 hypothetical protein BcepSaruman_435 [Burkholderia phage BcepSaruman]
MGHDISINDHVVSAARTHLYLGRVTAVTTNGDCVVSVRVQPPNLTLSPQLLQAEDVISIAGPRAYTKGDHVAFRESGEYLGVVERTSTEGDETGVAYTVTVTEVDDETGESDSIEYQFYELKLCDAPKLPLRFRDNVAFAHRPQFRIGSVSLVDKEAGTVIISSTDPAYDQTKWRFKDLVIYTDSNAKEVLGTWDYKTTPAYSAGFRLGDRVLHTAVVPSVEVGKIIAMYPSGECLISSPDPKFDGLSVPYTDLAVKSATSAVGKIEQEDRPIGVFLSSRESTDSDEAERASEFDLDDDRTPAKASRYDEDEEDYRSEMEEREQLARMKRRKPAKVAARYEGILQRSFERAWEREFPDAPDGSAAFAKDENGMYVRAIVRASFHMYCAGLANV